MMHQLWRAEPHGILSVEFHGFRLTVQAPAKAGGLVRFMVRRRATCDAHETLVGSGHEENVRDAMTAAERMARRLIADMSA